MPTPSKANYRSYEAQARMVRAMVAAHPEVKWNYKEIATCYGTDMTDHALNHRFRKIRVQALIIREGLAKGLDPKHMQTDENALPVAQDKVDKKNIAKYFGQSTADGMQFQFRSIKKDADVLRRTADQNGDVANCLNLSGSGAVNNTPSKLTQTKSMASRSGVTSKRSRKQELIKREASDDDEELEEICDWSGQDETPSKRVKTDPAQSRRSTTPSCRAAVQARDTITTSTFLQDIESSEDEPQGDTGPQASAPRVPKSIFGDVTPRPDIFESQAFKTGGKDQYMGDNVAFSFQSMDDGFDAGDGEI